MNITKKILFLTLISSLSGGILQAMNERRDIYIEFYEKGTENLKTDGPGYIGFLNFSDYLKADSSYINNIWIEKQYSGKGLMKLFMAYTVAYIYRTNPTVKRIEFRSSTRRFSQKTLDTVYLKSGAIKKINSNNNGFVFDLKKVKGTFLDILEIPLEKNSQIFKDIYVKIVNDHTKKQINSDIAQKNNQKAFCINQNKKFELTYVDEIGINFIPLKSSL